MSNFDHSSNEEFYEYYAEASKSKETRERFQAVRDLMLRVLKATGNTKAQLDIADIGCGAGTQCLIWAEMGHRVRGLDVNEPLVNLARKRAAEALYEMELSVGSATSLPWQDNSVDICLLPELLEHVGNWESCLREAMRILKPGGLLYLSTTNVLCPVQQEFSLPLYSWYPVQMKRYCVHLALTTKPHLANYAKYPAVHWFNYYQLRAIVSGYGFRCMDRFDLVDLTGKGGLARSVLLAIRAMPALRWLGHVATPYTVMVAEKIKS